MFLNRNCASAEGRSRIRSSNASPYTSPIHECFQQWLPFLARRGRRTLSVRPTWRRRAGLEQGDGNICDNRQSNSNIDICAAPATIEHTTCDDLRLECAYGHNPLCVFLCVERNNRRRQFEYRTHITNPRIYIEEELSIFDFEWTLVCILDSCRISNGSQPADW